MEHGLALQQKLNDDATGKYFLRLVNISYLCFHEEIAHTTNYSKMLGANAVYDMELHDWLMQRPGNDTYDSSATVIQLLQCCGEVVKRNVLS